jgi:MerR family mercuric resistance operon transcriptional regulator
MIENGPMATETLTTGEVADQANVNVQTVRYYERRGLIPEPPRSSGGFRQYSPDHVSRIRFIKRAQELGFTLEEANELLQLRVTPDADRADVRAVAQEKIEEVEEKIRDLRRIRDTLGHLVEACEGHGSTSECPILHAMEGAAGNGASVIQE